MSQHTPGPWAVKRRDSGFDIVSEKRTGYKNEIAILFSRGLESQVHNARLIACAPELYESLREIRGFLGKCKPSQDVTTAECFDAMSRADALLAKVAP